MLDCDPYLYYTKRISIGNNWYYIVLTKIGSQSDRICLTLPIFASIERVANNRYESKIS
ncbi:hypothetical protein [Chamaesiphon sp. GL140_3_metabinner_50]|uniref:hypothetical protein n=1 Tax=Chamaesiphon sp. GL140_3_metabinner_50 TaxID=2970812 RepID=UPI0025D6DDFB|nr:hypothetical protein [Chamaesiphon sp. GL140_3_metabinner_50]